MRTIGTIIGALLLLAGIPLTLSPLPFGVLPLIVGTAILAGTSPPFARWLRRKREDHRLVDAVIDKAEDVLPDIIADPLEATDPQPAQALIRRKDPLTPWRSLGPKV